MHDNQPDTHPKLSHALGHLLLWGGFLAAAFCSVLRTEQEAKWQTIPWAGYLLALAVGFAGVVLVRRAKRSHASDEAKIDAEYSTVRRSLDTLVAEVDRLNTQSDRKPTEVLHWIDDRCMEPFSEFAEARQALVKRFGMKVYADVMTEFASAERLVNRTWSAAADGYVDEVATSLQLAGRHLARAKELLAVAESQAARSICTHPVVTRSPG